MSSLRQSVAFCAAVLSGLTALSGCNDGAGLQYVPSDTAMPDFVLEDINPSSPTFGQQVSSRAQNGKVSAWYFGHTV